MKTEYGEYSVLPYHSHKSPCIHSTTYLVTLCEDCKLINDFDMTTHGALVAHSQGAAVTIGKFPDGYRFPSGNGYKATTTKK